MAEIEKGMEKLSPDDLEGATGGLDGGRVITWGRVIANAAAGHLAMRNSPDSGENNVISSIENGVSFLINESKTFGNFIWARFNNKEGWVSRDSIDRK